MIEKTKEEIINLKENTEYVIYNPLTKQLKIEKASSQDIVHNKHCYSELKFYVMEE